MNHDQDVIPVTRPTLPALTDFMSLIEESWKSRQLTSGPKGAPLVNRLEKALANLFGAEECVLVSNATVGLTMVLEAFNLKGQVITTPFTYVATSSSILAARCEPVYVDISEEDLNLDPSKIEAAITDKTVAIIPVHVFGQPCKMDAIKKIAEKYNLKIFYDAAHCFGSKYENASVFSIEEPSVLSMQATKIFQTGEGGAIFTSSKELAQKLRRGRIFGINESGEILEASSNYKMSELNAALGIALLPKMPEILEDRKRIAKRYRSQLQDHLAIRFPIAHELESNWSYVPLVFNSAKMKLKILESLREEGIFAREYFFPSLTQISCIASQGKTPIADDISSRILCLPSFYELPDRDIDRISSIIIQSLRG